MTTTNPEQWADKVLDDVIIAWSEHGHSAGIEAIQAAFAEREARLVDAFQEYRSQFGQALEAHNIPYGDAQQSAEDKARQALAALKDRTDG